ncbi:hypothetical protein DRW03_10645 [Corallococcus sp. H22C18031201]|nr:hypothetical protein DRW03_10645 [Corallococcus sp. H22C18031201]
MGLPVRPDAHRGARLARVWLAAFLLLPTSLALAGDARLRVAGANASGEVRLRIPTEDFSRELRVELLPGRASDGGVEESLPTGVTVLVDPLTATADGVQVALGASVREALDGGTTAGLTTRQPVHVVLSGRLPSAGEYTGSLVLVHEGVREVTTLTVTRVLSAPVVQLPAPAPAMASSHFLGTEAEVRLPFKETAGVAGVVASPTLLELRRKGPDTGTGSVQSHLERARFLVEGGLPDGGDLPLVGDATELPVAAYGSGALLLRMEGLDGPGEYSGTVRLSVRQGAPVEQAFTLWVHLPWGWGALIIALGSLCSYGLRLYAQRIRPRAVRLQRAQELRRRIQAQVTAHATQPERGVGEALLAQVDALISDIERPVRGVAVSDAELTALEPRLRLYESWCDTWRRARPLQSLLSEATERLLAGVGQRISDSDSTPQELATAASQLRELDVQALARAELEARWKSLDTQAQALARQLGSDSALGFRLTYELLPLLEDVHALLSQDLDATRQRLEQARRSYFGILCAELTASLASDVPPRGFSPQEWGALRTDVLAKLAQARQLADTDLDAAFRQYQEAHATSVRRLILALRGAVEEARAMSATDAQRAALDDMGAKLRDAMGFLSRESPHEAAALYEKVRDAFTLYENPPRAAAASATRGRVLPFADEEAVPAPAPVPGAAPPASAPMGGSLPSMPAAPSEPALGELGGLPLPGPRKLMAIELLSLLLLTGVAVALGLQLLNVFSPTWGGFGSALTAFLWGFGLHQVGNATFEGVAGLWTKLER